MSASLTWECMSFLLPLTDEHPETRQSHFLFLGQSPLICPGAKGRDPDVDADGIVSVIWVCGFIPVEGTQGLARVET